MAAFAVPDGRKVRVLDGEAGIARAIREEFTAAARAAIAKKGSFSIAIPGGSVVKALEELPADALDFSKVHVYFCNERIGENKCYKGAVKALKGKVPEAQIHGVGTGTPQEVAARYAAVLRAAPSVDNSGKLPSVDLVLLGTGDDGHCGSLYPDSDATKATGQGKAVLPIDEAKKKSVAVSIDFMCAAKKAVLGAATKKRAPMVARALSNSFGPHDCPSGMVKAADTTWLCDAGSIAEYKSKAKL